MFKGIKSMLKNATSQVRLNDLAISLEKKLLGELLTTIPLHEDIIKFTVGKDWILF